jgi:hypothetical protein
MDSIDCRENRQVSGIHKRCFSVACIHSLNRFGIAPLPRTAPASYNAESGARIEPVRRN